MVIVSIPAVLNLLVSPYPQIKTEPLCVPPNKNWTPLRTPKSNSKEETDQNIIIFSLFHILCVPPAACSRTPRGTRTPGWEPLVYTMSTITELFEFNIQYTFVFLNNTYSIIKIWIKIMNVYQNNLISYAGTILFHFKISLPLIHNYWDVSIKHKLSLNMIVQ